MEDNIKDNEKPSSRDLKIPYEKCCVQWVDSVTYKQWEYLEDINANPFKSESTGYLVKETEDALVLAHTTSMTEENYVAGFIVIPKVSIINKVFLSKTKYPSSLDEVGKTGTQKPMSTGLRPQSNQSNKE